MNSNHQYPPRRFRDAWEGIRDIRDEREQQKLRDFREWEQEQRHNFRHWQPEFEGFRDRGYPDEVPHRQRPVRSGQEVQRHVPPGHRTPRHTQIEQSHEREKWRPSSGIGHMEQYAHMNRLVGGESFGSDYRRMLKAMDDYWQGGMDDRPDYGSYYEERGSAFRPESREQQQSGRRRNTYGQEEWNRASLRNKRTGRH